MFEPNESSCVNSLASACIRELKWAKRVLNSNQLREGDKGAVPRHRHTTSLHPAEVYCSRRSCVCVCVEWVCLSVPMIHKGSELNEVCRLSVSLLSNDQYRQRSVLLFMSVYALQTNVKQIITGKLNS